MNHSPVPNRWAKCRAVAVLCGVGMSLLLAGCGGGGGSSTAGSTGSTGHSTAPSDRGGAGPTGTRSVKLMNMHNWILAGDARPGNAEFDAALRTAAKKDNVIMTEMYWWQRVTPQMIKAINPQAKVYLWYDLCVKSDFEPDWAFNNNDKSRMQLTVLKSTIDENDWWLRGKNGEIIKEHEHTWFVDVGKPGYKEEFLKNVLEKNAGKGFDGFVFDYWWFRIDQFCKNNRPVDYPTDEDWFNKAWKPFIQYVCTGLHEAGYKVIGNCAGEYMTGNAKIDWMRTQLDGVIYEQGAVDWGDDPHNSAWLPGSTVTARINRINQDPMEVWVGNHGVRKNAPEAERRKLVALAMYYVAIPKSQEKRCFSVQWDNTSYWDPLWDLNIGTPVDAAPEKLGTYSWVRTYTNGVVLLNYESNTTASYTLNKTYRDIDGKVYSGKVQIPPHTGMILVDN